MLENTNFWEEGRLDLYLNNKPTRAYVPKDDVKKLYELSQKRIADDGKIPIGIDHLPEEVIKNNPILSKLDLLHVGDITAVEYDNRNNTVKIKEADITNPLIRNLYENNELDAVSIVSQVTTRPCPKDNEVRIIETESIDRVDIVAVGACESCTIPRPNQGSNEMVYARKPLKPEDETMADELTIEQIEELFDKKFDEKFDEKLEPINERIEALENAEPTEPVDEGEEGEEAEAKAMKARIAQLEKEAKEAKEKAIAEAASAKVDVAIQAGKIKPADRETMTAFARNASEEFDAYIKDAPVIVPIKQRLAASSSEDEINEYLLKDLSEDEKAALEEVQAAYPKGDE